MKCNKYILLFFSLLAAFVSCNTMKEQEIEDRITLAKESNRELHFSGNGESKTIVLKATGVWTAESDSDWCHTDPSEGLVSDMKLTISVDPNDQEAERTAHVTITSGTAFIEITVIQSEAYALTIDEADYVVEAEGGNIEVTVSHNVDYVVNIPASAPWIKEVKSKKLSVMTHEFIIEPNEATEERTAEIVFECEEEGLTETITVFQKPAESVEKGITLANESNRELYFSCKGDTKVIVLKATDVWTAESDSDWCHADPAEGLASDMKLTISVDPNHQTEDRTAYVTLTCATASLEIKVIQSEAFELTIDEADYVVEAEGGNIEVTVMHNVEYVVDIPASAPWIKEVKSKKLSATTHEFIIEPNEATEERAVKITFECEEKGLSEVITVFQKPAEPKVFIFSIYHNGPDFMMPLFGGDFTGTVFWGDMNSDEFGSKDLYEYGIAEDRTIRFELYGDPDDLDITFFDLVGITGLDLSELPVD